MKQLLSVALSVVMFVLPACATPTPAVTLSASAVQTRIAATLGAIPTAANLTPLARTATPAPEASETPQPPTAGSAALTEAPQAGEYVVQAGDTLSAIAVKFNTSMAALQLLNNLDDARLVRAGQRLKIPAQKLASDENPFWFVYVVQPNETFGEIALKFGVQLADLLRVNAITNPSLVRAGQRLIIPLRALA